MNVRLIGDRRYKAILILPISCIFIAFILAGCADDYSSYKDTGSYTCTLNWPEDVPTLETTSRSARAIDCDAAGVAIVAFNFYDGSGNFLTEDEWSCSLHEGTVNGIPAGTDRRLVVTGEDSSHTVLYHGEKTGITITAGETTQGGEIVMVLLTSPSAPTNVTATAGDKQVTISWDSVSGATIYNLYWATYSGVSKTDYEGLISDVTSPYTHTGLTNGTTYYYVVTAENSYGESGQSSEVNTVPDACLVAPLKPDTVAARPGDGQVEISWGSVDCATSYNIYWATYSGVSKTDYEGLISDVTSPYTHTGRTNGTTYYYVLTAESSYGESEESSEVSTTPSIAYRWTMLNLPDTGQTQSLTEIFGEDSDYTINPPSYTDNGNGTVTDTVTGLMWQQEDDDTTRTWDEACTYCESLAIAGYSGYSDWRLPSKKELMSIANWGTYEPAINTTYFPGTETSSSGRYWSLTPHVYWTGSAWYVQFDYGALYHNSKSKEYYVRCVRGGQ